MSTMTMSDVVIAEPSSAVDEQSPVAFLAEISVTRAADHPFWSKVRLEVDSEGTWHWVRRKMNVGLKFTIPADVPDVYRGVMSRHWAWWNLQEELGLPALDALGADYRLCPHGGCIDPRHMFTPPVARELRCARPDLVSTDPRWADVGVLRDDQGEEHWLWQGKDALAQADRWVWHQLRAETGRPVLASYLGLRRMCAQRACLRPEHLESELNPVRTLPWMLGPLTPVWVGPLRDEDGVRAGALYRRERELADLRRRWMTRTSAAKAQRAKDNSSERKSTARTSKPTRDALDIRAIRRQQRAQRYLEDAAFREKVRAELREQKIRRREKARARTTSAA